MSDLKQQLSLHLQKVELETKQSEVQLKIKNASSVSLNRFD